MMNGCLKKKFKIKFMLFFQNRIWTNFFWNKNAGKDTQIYVLGWKSGILVAFDVFISIRRLQNCLYQSINLSVYPFLYICKSWKISSFYGKIEEIEIKGHDRIKYFGKMIFTKNSYWQNTSTFNGVKWRIKTKTTKS